MTKTRTVDTDIYFLMPSLQKKVHSNPVRVHGKEFSKLSEGEKLGAGVQEPLSGVMLAHLDLLKHGQNALLGSQIHFD